MALRRTTGLAALALLAVLLVLCGLLRPEIALTVQDGEGKDKPSAPADSLPADLAPRHDDRGDVSPAQLPAYEPPDLDHPFAFELEVRVVDAFGLPVPETMVFVAPPACGFAMLPAPTDAAGRATIAFHGRTAHVELTVAVLPWGIMQPLRRVALTAATPRRLTIAASGPQQTDQQIDELLRTIDRHDERRHRPAPRRQGRIRRRDELDALCGRTLLMYMGCDCRQCHEPSRIAAYESLRRAKESGPGLHPHAVFADQALHDLPEDELRNRDLALLEHKRADNLQRRMVRSGGTSAAVTGSLLDADGRPAVGVPVAWLDPTGGLGARTTTDRQGNYRLQPVDPGNKELVAGGNELGRARTMAAIVAYGNSEWHDRLQRGDVVRGRATDERGNPLAGCRVEYDAERESWTGVATTREDGSFLLANVPERGRCFLWGTDADLRLPVLASAIALPNGEPVALHCDRTAPTRARLRLRPVLPQGSQLTPVEVRVSQEDTGRAALMVRMGFDDQFEIDGLAAGAYRVEVGAPGLGWVAPRPVIVDGRGLWDLGALVLQAPGRVVVHVAEGTASPLAGQHAWYRRTEAVDVREFPAPAEGNAVALPRGEHLLLWRTDDNVRAVLVTVEAGRTTDVRIPPR